MARQMQQRQDEELPQPKVQSEDEIVSDSESIEADVKLGNKLFDDSEDEEHKSNTNLLRLTKDKEMQRAIIQQESPELV